MVLNPLVYIDHFEHARRIRKDLLPWGNGIEDEPVDLDKLFSSIKANTLRLDISYHHMTEHGYYDGYTYHAIRVHPGWNGINITISGPDRNGVKDYLHDTFHYVLTQECPETHRYVVIEKHDGHVSLEALV